MPLHITPELLEQSYELLRLTPPFRGWKLPHADEVIFHVTVFRYQGDHCNERDAHQIRISARKHKTLRALLETVAHEMVHVQQSQLGKDTTHGVLFHKLADQVCRHHGFDRGQF